MLVYQRVLVLTWGQNLSKMRIDASKLGGYQNWEGPSWQFKHLAIQTQLWRICQRVHCSFQTLQLLGKVNLDEHVGLYQNIYNGDQRGAQQLLVSEPLRKNFQSHSPKHGLRPRLHEENFMISMLQLVFLVYFPSISISQHFSWDSNIWGFP